MFCAHTMGDVRQKFSVLTGDRPRPALAFGV